MTQRQRNLQRLLMPRHVALFGGDAAAEALRQCRKLGFEGPIWPVHPSRDQIEGLPCFRSVAELPTAPDASFIAVPRQATIDIVAQLAARAAGGAVCYASGFAEVGAAGLALQQQLVAAAGDMALLGPNCYGMLNYLDGVALWPDQHGGLRLNRGVAIITQSGNIGLNLSMQNRALPLAYLVTVGNKAGASLEAIVQSLMQDERVTAIGLHIEGLDDVPAFSRVAQQALRRKLPLVVLKSGSSILGAQTAMSHTSSLAGPDALYQALFDRFGVARVHEPAALLETLKFFHVHGALAGQRIISASCSGGEASLVADLAQPRGLDMPELPPAAHQRLHAVLGDKVHVSNPLDYHTYIWGDSAAQTECFSALLDCGFDAHLLVLDFPRLDRCSAASWQTTVDAFVAASAPHSSKACVVSSLPEGFPESVANDLLRQGIAPMQEIGACLDAIVHAAALGRAQQKLAQIQALPDTPVLRPGTVRMLDEAASKAALSAFSVPVPQGAVLSEDALADHADQLGYPLVLKAVSDTLAHKTQAGGVHLKLMTREQVQQAAQAMRALSDRFLLEQMATEVVAEIVVGVCRDAQFGLTLTLGAGGIWVELLHDSVTLLLPVSRLEVLTALQSLKVWPLLNGYRGQPVADVEALLDAVMSVLAYAQANVARLHELEVNPLLVLARGRGVLAVDAMIRQTPEE